MGDKRGNLANCRSAIRQQIGKIHLSSSIFETEAWGNTDQGSFLNQAIEICTELSPKDLLTQCNEIEAQLGRVRAEKWGARIIDIDILYYQQYKIISSSLVVPHPEIPNRRFTLVPLVEIARDLINPVLKKSNQQLLEDCKDQLEVKKFVDLGEHV